MFLLFLLLNQTIFSKKITIILNPAYHAMKIHRTINGVKEQTIALRFCEYIKQIVETVETQIRVIIYHPTHASHSFYTNASFANQMNPDFYFAFNFYEKKQGTPECGLYHFSLNQTTDKWQKKDSTLTFIPFFKAHQNTSKITEKCIKSIQKLLSEQLPTLLIHNPLSVPCNALAGITAPAFLIELSLTTDTQWQHYTEPIAKTLINLCKQEIT